MAETKPSIKIGPTGIYLSSKNNNKSSLTSDDYGNLIADAKSFSVSLLTGSTGYFKSLSVDSTGISLGQFAGSSNGSVNVGYKAGQYNQGEGSIAIGQLAGPTSMSKNSIVLNASGKELYGTGPTGGFYVAPIFMAHETGITGANTILAYGPDKQIIGVTGDALTYLGLGSTKEKSNDLFIRNNFIDPPDFIENITVTQTSSDIYIMFDYPKQMNYGFGLLPVVSNLNFLIKPVGGGQTGFTGLASPQIIKSALTSSVVQCIDISKTKNMGETGMNNNKIYYAIPYNESGAFDVTIWYGNGSILSNKKIVGGPLSYTTSGIPSAPTTDVRFPPNIKDNSITFRFIGSSQIDVNDPLSSADLRYKVFYTPTENQRRFGGAFDLGVTGTYSGNLTNVSNGNALIPYVNGYFNVGNVTGSNYTVNIAQIYPDTKYNIKVDASNTLSQGFTGFNTEFTTTHAPPPTFVSPGSNQVTLSGLISGRAVSGATLVTNILPPNTSSSFILQNFPIHNGTGSRGAAGPTPLVTFTSSVTGPAGTTIITGPSASYTGFGTSYAYGTSSASNINMTLSTPADVTGLAGYDGYYLRGNVTMGLSSALTNGLTASTTPYALSVTGTYSASNSAVSVNYSAPFYYDGQQTPAITGTPTLSIVSAGTGMVCGITVVTGSIGLSVTVPGVTGFGNFFYNSNNILRYVGNVGILSPSVETSLSSNAIPDLVSGMYTFTSPLTITSLPTFRQGAITINATPVNLYGALGDSKSAITTKDIFMDSNSVTNSLTAFPVSYNPNISSSTLTSFVRVYSTMDPTGCTKKPSTSTINDITIINIINGTPTPTPYATNIYDNTRSLTSPAYTNELLYTGMTTTSSIFVGGPSATYYKNYNTFEYNTIADYSEIRSGTRYATFAWRVNPTVFSSTTPFGTLTFTLRGVAGTTITNGTVYPSNSSTPLFIYYRVEDSSSLNLPTNNNNNPCITTFWINANDTGPGALINTQNCYAGSTVSYYKGVESPSAASSGGLNIILPAKTGGYGFSSSNRPSNGNNNTPVYVYLRIGLPIQATDLYFTNVTCALT
jgi:hypothetical protein